MNGHSVFHRPRHGPRRVRRNILTADSLPAALAERLDLPRAERGFGFRLPIASGELARFQQARPDPLRPVLGAGRFGIPNVTAPPPEQDSGVLASAGRISGAALRAVDDLFREPFGMRREAFGLLVPQTPEQARGIIGTVRTFNDVFLRGGSQAVDIAGRVALAPFAGAIAATSQSAQELGMSRTNARRLERDLTALLVSVGTVTGSGARMRATRPNRLLAEADRRGLFDKAIDALPPGRRAGARERLREAFREGHRVAGEAARGSGVGAKSPASAGSGKVVIDLFGGRTSQIPGAVNVDIRNRQRRGVLARVPDRDQFPHGREKFVPVRDNAADEVFAIGPLAPFLDEAHRMLKPGGRLTVVATRGNRHGRLPSNEVLKKRGFRVLQRDGALPPRIARLTFRRVNDTEMPAASQRATILEKIR